MASFQSISTIASLHNRVACGDRCSLFVEGHACDYKATHTNAKTPVVSVQE
jgi:hypothetical protein